MKTRTGLLIFATTLIGLTTLSMTGCNKSPEASGAPGSHLVGAELSDDVVTNKVKTVLLNDNNVKSFDIAVVTTKGDVRLTGILDNQDQIDRAISLARAVEGVHAIHDELTLKK
jgi:hyperosmotically inducible protein